MFQLSSTRRVVGASIACFVLSFFLIPYDWAPSESVHQALRPWDWWLQRLTWLGDGRFLTPFCIFLFLILWIFKKRQKQVALLALAGMAFSGAISHLLKFVLGRPRPYLLNDPRYPGVDFSQFHWFAFHSDFASFPSGHTAAVFSVVWIFASLKMKGWQRILLLTVALLVTFSRVALAKHFFADVLAGAALGVAFSQWVLHYYVKRLGVQS